MTQHHRAHGATRAVRGFLYSLFWAAALASCGATDSVPGPPPQVEPVAWAANPNLRAYRVLETLRRPADDIIELGTTSGTISTTPEHPFALAGAGWVRSADLQVGDRIVTAQQGRVATILTTGHKHQSATVYNLTVEDAHAYFVGTDALLVHNVCGFADYDQGAAAAADYMKNHHPKGQAVIDYTGDEYSKYNAYLRGNTAGLTPEDVAKYAKKTADADKALKDAAAAGLDYRGTVYRGIDTRTLPPSIRDQIRNMQPGDIYSDPALTSTSIDKDVAEDFAQGGIIFEIHNTHGGIPMEGLTQYQTEKEVLFRAGTRFIFRGKHTDPVSGLTVYEFDQA